MEVLPLLGTTGFLLMSLKNAPRAGVYVRHESGYFVDVVNFTVNKCGERQLYLRKKGSVVKKSVKTTALDQAQTRIENCGCVCFEFALVGERLVRRA